MPPSLASLGPLTPSALRPNENQTPDAWACVAEHAALYGCFTRLERFAIAALRKGRLTLRHPTRGWPKMTSELAMFDSALGLAVAAVLFVYLMVALLAPEKF
jgi:K+-transporting ATPase KdpF subunit